MDHVRQRQAYYLGCIFAVIREWHARGKPRSDDTRHDFREWVQVVDWITRNILETAPVMDGHQQAQERVSNPALIWLRRVVLAINEAVEVNQALTATDLYGLCDTVGIEIPGLRQGSDEKQGPKVIGTLMAKLFRDCDALDVDGFVVVRQQRNIARANSCDGGDFTSKTYTVKTR